MEEWERKELYDSCSSAEKTTLNLVILPVELEPLLEWSRDVNGDIRAASGLVGWV